MPTSITKKTSKTKKTKKTTGPKICSLDGCAQYAGPSGYCLAHNLISQLSDAAEGYMEGAGSLAFDAMDLILRRSSKNAKVQEVREKAEAEWQRAQQSATQQRQKTNPFQILRLNPQTATVADVKRMQRALAAIYHDDKGTTGIDESAMAEINAAADACIKWIEKRK